MNKNIKSVLKTESKVIAYVVICLVIIILGISYALFFQVKKNEKNQIVKAGTLEFSYENGSEITTEGNEDCFIPTNYNDAITHSECEYNVSITNSGTLPGVYSLTLTSIAQNNPVGLDKLKVILKKEGTVESTTTISELNNEILVENEKIPAGGLINYTVQVYVDEETVDETDDEKEIALQINGRAEVSTDEGINPNFEVEQDGGAVKLLEQRAEEEQSKEEPELVYDDTDDRNLRYVGASPNNYIDIGNRYRSDIYSISYSEYAKPFGEYSSYEECTESIDYLAYSYSGATCEKTHNEGDPILWRVVGVMNNMTNVEKNTKESLIKIVRVDDIGLSIFDINQYHNENIYIGINDYSQSGLMKLLNDGYNTNTVYNINDESEEPINNSLYWNSESGKCVYKLGNGGDNYDGYITKNCNFTTNGLENEVKNKLAKVRWNTGALDASQYLEDDNDSYTKNIYKLERMDNVPCGGDLNEPCVFANGSSIYEDGMGRNTFWDGHIGLFYNSDYFYAIGGVDRDKCLELGFRENLEELNCDNNWFYNYAYAHDSTYTINPIYSPNGMNLFGKGAESAINQDYTVYPVAYLKSSVSITNALGTKENPFVAS